MCVNTEKPCIVICPKETTIDSETVQNKCDIIYTDLSFEDYINSLALMHFKYFNVLDSFYEEITFDAKTEDELKNHDQLHRARVKDFSYNNFPVNLDYYAMKDKSYYALKPEKFKLYYEYCREVNDILFNN